MSVTSTILVRMEQDVMMIMLTTLANVQTTLEERTALFHCHGAGIIIVLMRESALSGL